MMKTKVNLIRLLVLTGMFIASGYSAKAGNSGNVSLYMMQKSQVLITANNSLQQSLTVTIVNSTTEQELYTSIPVNDASYKKYFDLSKLPEDKYTIYIKLDNQVFEKVIQLGDNVPVLLAETTYAEPVFVVGDKSLEVLVSNPKKEEVLISFQKNSQSFFEDEPSNLGSFKRKYNLKNLDPGEYQVELMSGGKFYNHTFEIE